MSNVAFDILTLLIGSSSLLICISVRCVRGGLGWLDGVYSGAGVFQLFQLGILSSIIVPASCGVCTTRCEVVGAFLGSTQAVSCYCI